MALLKKLFSGKTSVAGIDIGSSMLKLVELEENSAGYSLKNYGQIPVEKGIVENGMINDHQALARKIKQLYKVAGCKTKNVVSALSGHAVIIKKAMFRNMDEDALRELIIDEASEYMPFDNIEEVNFDFHVLGTNAYNPEQIEVVIAAAKKESIESLTYSFEKAGCKVGIVDVDSFALETAYEVNYDFAEDDVAVLVNMGVSITNINVLKGGESVFTRNILMGEQSIIESMEKSDEASPENPISDVISEGNAATNEQQKKFLTHAEPIFMEIERSIDYFSSTLDGSFIKEVLVCGGCVQKPGMLDALQNRLQYNVELFNSFRNISYNEKKFKRTQIQEISPVAAIRVGLALRRMDDK